MAVYNTTIIPQKIDLSGEVDGVTLGYDATNKLHVLNSGVSLSKLNLINRALGVTVTQSGWSAGWEPTNLANAVDGDDTTYTTYGTTNAGSYPGGTITADLGVVTSGEKAYYKIGYKSYAGAGTTYVKVEISNDGSTWYELASGSTTATTEQILEGYIYGCTFRYIRVACWSSQTTNIDAQARVYEFQLLSVGD